jgi:hypothetical protein
LKPIAEGFSSIEMPMGVIPYEDLVPMFYPEFVETENKLLFVGINPSLTNKAHAYLRDNKIDSFQNLIASPHEIREEIIEKLIKYQHSLIHGPNPIPYFTMINGSSKCINPNHKLEHYDLFSIRYTNQNLFLRLMRTKEMKPYHSGSIERFKKVLEGHKFKAVIFLNRHGSELIHEELKLNEPIDGSFKNRIYGYYRCNDVKLFLFKQLTGGGTTPTEREKFEELVRRNLD